MLFVLSLIWFSPVQVDNWLWGWQLEWFLNILGVTIVALVISSIKRHALTHKQLVTVILASTLSQYSLGNGTLVWPLAIATLLYIRVPLRQILSVVASGVLATFLYYFHYTNPAGPSKSVALKEPVAFLKSILLYIERPLLFLHRLGIAELLGLLVLVTFFLVSAHLFIYRRKEFNLSLPWIFLGLYAVASAVITSLARVGFGVNATYTSRYATISMLLIISTLIVCLRYWDGSRTHKAKTRPQTIGTVLFILLSLSILQNAAWGVNSFNNQHRSLSYLKTCTHQQSPTDQCLLTAYPDKLTVAQRLNYLKQTHWGGY
jgi:hypothetical protein